MRAGEGHASAGLGLCDDGGMAYDLGKDEGCSVKRKIAVLGRSDGRGKCRAFLRDGRETCSGAGGSFLLQIHHAVVCAVPSAAGGQIRFATRRERKERSDQRRLKSRSNVRLRMRRTK